MDLSSLRIRLSEVEAQLCAAPLVEFSRHDTRSDTVVVWISERLRRRCMKGKVWKTAPMLSALKNCQYGLDPARARSRGGKDGVFLLDRGFRPRNEMMRRLFDRFLDKPDSLVAVIASTFGLPTEKLVPVRVVSHHLRLLGVLASQDHVVNLVLVDYDDTKHD